MISLKKYLDSRDSESLSAAMGACRDLLAAIGECGSKVCPHVGDDLQSELASLQRRLRGEAEPDALAPAQAEAEKALRSWGERASNYYKAKAQEVRELMLVLARAAESVGDRDHRYSSELNSLTERLQAIANLEDVSKLRGALTANVQELRKCVSQMTKENTEAVKRLNSEVATYRSRLEETERIASVDALTGLANRRRIELALDQLVLRGRPFSVLVFDINDFKRINDQYGHMAGDDLLRQFAVELKLALRSSDLAGRWGGDEFIVVMDCDGTAAETQRQRIREWVVGEYTLRTGSGSQRVAISTAIGMAVWTRDTNLADTLNQADAAMYADKQMGKVEGGAPQRGAQR